MFTGLYTRNALCGVVCDQLRETCIRVKFNMGRANGAATIVSDEGVVFYVYVSLINKSFGKWC